MTNQLCDAWDALRKPDVEFLGTHARESLVRSVKRQLAATKRNLVYNRRPLVEFLAYVDKNP